MKRDEFLKRVEGLKEHLDGWKIEVDHLSKAEYILGCYYDNEDRTWKVYINEERGWQSIRLTTPIEDKAFDKLFSIVEAIPGNLGSVQHVNPATGTTVFVNPVTKEIVGIWPNGFMK